MNVWVLELVTVGEEEADRILGVYRTFEDAASHVLVNWIDEGVGIESWCVTAPSLVWYAEHNTGEWPSGLKQRCWTYAAIVQNDRYGVYISEENDNASNFVLSRWKVQ